MRKILLSIIFIPAFAIAADFLPNADDTDNLGSSSLRWKQIYSTDGTVQTSDATLKKEIKNSDLGLDFINKIRPVSYKWSNGSSDTHYGFIAQEIEATINGRSFGGLVNQSEYAGFYGLRYTEFTAPMVKAIQELSQENEELKTRIERLEKLIK